MLQTLTWPSLQQRRLKTKLIMFSSSSSNLGTGFTRECIRFRENFAQCRATQQLKSKNGLIDIDSHQYIQANDSRTRGKDRLYQERTSSETFGNSFFPKTIRDWNQLPANTTPANTVEGFFITTTSTQKKTYHVLFFFFQFRNRIHT
jgi:hypothetical protein